MLIGGLALLTLITERLRKKSGAGWVDFVSQFGKNFVIVVPALKVKLTPGMIVAIAIGGLIIWITVMLMEPDAPQGPKGPLEMEAPKSADAKAGTPEPATKAPK